MTKHTAQYAALLTPYKTTRSFNAATNAPHCASVPTVIRKYCSIRGNLKWRTNKMYQNKMYRS